MSANISIVRCGDYDPEAVQRAVREAVGLIGGITSFVKSGSKVLVKPNNLMGAPPETGINTHPEVVRAVIRILKEIGCKVFVGDSPSVFGKQIQNLDEVFVRSGIKGVCQREGVELVDFSKRRWRNKFPLTSWLDSCDYLISVPKFKTHELTLLTGAIKNLFGLVCGTFKAELHKNYMSRHDFAGIIVDVFQEARPALTIIDGIVAMEGDGPASGGKLRNLGLLLAGADCVALDAVLAGIMGVKPCDVLTTYEASRRGLGVADLGSILISGIKLEEAKAKPFLLPTTSLINKLPAFITGLAIKFIRYYPFVLHKNCISCGACIKACPAKVMRMKKGRVAISYAKCIACFCCQEACPYKAIKIKRSLLAKLIGL